MYRLKVSNHIGNRHELLWSMSISYFTDSVVMGDMLSYNNYITVHNYDIPPLLKETILNYQ